MPLTTPQDLCSTPIHVWGNIVKGIALPEVLHTEMQFNLVELAANTPSVLGCYLVGHSPGNEKFHCVPYVIICKRRCPYCLGSYTPRQDTMQIYIGKYSATSCP